MQLAINEIVISLYSEPSFIFQKKQKYVPSHAHGALPILARSELFPVPRQTMHWCELHQWTQSGIWTHPNTWRCTWRYPKKRPRPSSKSIFSFFVRRELANAVASLSGRRSLPPRALVCAGEVDRAGPATTRKPGRPNCPLDRAGCGWCAQPELSCTCCALLRKL